MNMILHRTGTRARAAALVAVLGLMLGATAMRASAEESPAAAAPAATADAAAAATASGPLTATPTTAPTEPTVVKLSDINSGDTAWMMTSTALVLFMTLPGLALFYGGLVRTKNVLSVLAQCLGITGIVTSTVREMMMKVMLATKPSAITPSSSAGTRRPARTSVTIG